MHGTFTPGEPLFTGICRQRTASGRTGRAACKRLETESRPGQTAPGRSNSGQTAPGRIILGKMPPRVNVLKLNLALDETAPVKKSWGGSNPTWGANPVRCFPVFPSASSTCRFERRWHPKADSNRSSHRGRCWIYPFAFDCINRAKCSHLASNGSPGKLRGAACYLSGCELGWPRPGVSASSARIDAGFQGDSKLWR